jgi:RNA polymerase sigma factor (sigma-70 family)
MAPTEGALPAVSLEELARRTIDGNRDALDQLVRGLQGHIYGLAIRMLWNREDAEDATQEILIRIVTRLSQFDFRSRLTTWAYRVAVNYILDTKKSGIERLHMSFGRFAEDLEKGLQPIAPADSEQSVLIEEVKVGCSLAMLQCLDRPHRAAYVLGELMDLSGPEAAEALNISAELFRKRLQYARETIVTFTRAHCGLVSDTAACRCNRRITSASVREAGMREPLQFAARAISFDEARGLVRQVEEARWAFQLHRTSHPQTSTRDLARHVVDTIELWWHRDGTGTP